LHCNSSVKLAAALTTALIVPAAIIVPARPHFRLQDKKSWLTRSTGPLHLSHPRLTFASTATPALVAHTQGGITLSLEEGELDADFTLLGGLVNDTENSPPKAPFSAPFPQVGSDCWVWLKRYSWKPSLPLGLAEAVFLEVFLAFGSGRSDIPGSLPCFCSFQGSNYY
jgi:hypothetical protein